MHFWSDCFWEEPRKTSESDASSTAAAPNLSSLLRSDHKRSFKSYAMELRNVKAHSIAKELQGQGAGNSSKYIWRFLGSKRKDVALYECRNANTRDL
jgi:hypothetical protein